jgi:hypothetical protein
MLCRRAWPADDLSVRPTVAGPATHVVVRCRRLRGCPSRELAGRPLHADVLPTGLPAEEMLKNVGIFSKMLFNIFMKMLVKTF